MYGGKEEFSPGDIELLRHAVDNTDKRIGAMLKKQLLDEYISDSKDNKDIIRLYCGIFGVSPDTEFSLTLFYPESETAQNKLIQYLGKLDGVFVINCHTGGPVTAVDAEDIDPRERFSQADFAGWGVSAVYNEAVTLEGMKKEYTLLQERAKGLFYTSKPGIFSKNEIGVYSTQRQLRPQFDIIERAVINGDVKKATALCEEVFEQIEKSCLSPENAITLFAQLYMSVLFGCDTQNVDAYTKGILRICNSRSMQDIRKYILKKVSDVIKSNVPRNVRMYSSLINETISIIEENLSNENLSLRWIAGTVLYTNVDYLGKLFKKETGKNFSHYVMEKRMEMAKEMIVEGKKDKIYEVAERVGYGSNSQYFSQVFKKYTGVSPLEYKEYVRIASRQAN